MRYYLDQTTSNNEETQSGWQVPAGYSYRLL